MFAILPPDLDPGRRAHYGPGNRRAFASEADAAAWLAAEITRLRTPAPGAAHPAEETGAYLTRWLKDNRPLMPERTFVAYRRALRAWLPYLGTVPLGQLTREQVTGALARLTEATWQPHKKDGTPCGTPRPYSPKTLAFDLLVLGKVLEELVPDVLPRNPARRVRRPRFQPVHQPVWDGVQAARFMDTAEQQVPHAALAFRLILWRALRRGEVLSLQWADVDTARKLLVVDETAGLRAGETGPTKGRRQREVPLGDDLLARLAAQRRRVPLSCAWVFPNPDTGLPYADRTLVRWARTLALSAGLPPIPPKDMRASCSSILLDEGIPLPRVSRLLGHSSVAITAAHYERLLEQRADRVTRVADELDAALARAARAAEQGAPRPLHRSSP